VVPCLGKDFRGDFRQSHRCDLLTGRHGFADQILRTGAMKGTSLLLLLIWLTALLITFVALAVME